MKKNNVLENLIEYANAGDAISQMMLGDMYYDGEYVPRNRTLGLKYLKKASAQGLGAASVSIAIIYKDEHNIKEAVKWYEKSVEQGDVNGMYLYGRMLLFGEEIPRDEEKGIQLIMKAALLGDEGAIKLIRELAEHYNIIGLNLPQD